MYYSKKNSEPVPEEQTSIWTCSKDDCECWMRDDFSFKTQPHCPICDSVMEQSSKVLPILKNQ